MLDNRNNAVTAPKPEIERAVMLGEDERQDIVIGKVKPACCGCGERCQAGYLGPSPGCESKPRLRDCGTANAPEETVADALQKRWTRPRS